MTARDVQRAGHLSRLTNEVRIWAASSSIDCVTEHDAEYDARRFVYNRMHDLRPLAVLSPRSREQVALSLRYAGQLDVPVAVRGGGHHIAGFGTCQDGLVIDLRHFNDVDISSSGPEVTVGGGARLRDVDASLCRRGLVVPTGTVSDTGIGGLTLGGGIGWLIGCFGLTLRQLDRSRRHSGKRHPHTSECGSSGRPLGFARRRRELWRGHTLSIPCSSAPAMLRRKRARAAFRGSPRAHSCACVLER